MRLGQVVQLLHARAQAHAQPFAAAEGDQRVRQLVALAERIGPRVHEAEDALHAVGRGQHQRAKPTASIAEQRREVAPVHAAEEQDAERGHRDHDKRAEVGLAQQQPRHQQHHARASAAGPCGSSSAPRACARCSRRRRAPPRASSAPKAARLTSGRSSQRRAPFTSRPMPGISTSTSSATPPMKSQGARLLPPARRHQEHGDRGASASAEEQRRAARGTRRGCCRYSGSPRRSRSRPNTPSPGRSRRAAAPPRRASGRTPRLAARLRAKT